MLDEVSLVLHCDRIRFFRFRLLLHLLLSAVLSAAAACNVYLPFTNGWRRSVGEASDDTTLAVSAQGITKKINLGRA